MQTPGMKIPPGIDLNHNAQIPSILMAFLQV